MPHHPRPDTPESKVEHQADQPGVTTGGESQGSARPGQHQAEAGRKQLTEEFDGGQSGRAYHGPGQLGDEATKDEQANAPASK